MIRQAKSQRHGMNDLSRASMSLIQRCKQRARYADDNSREFCDARQVAGNGDDDWDVNLR